IDGDRAEKGQIRGLIKPDELFALAVEVHGDTMRVLINGRTTSSLNFAQDAHPAGAIGLHIARGTVRVTKFEVAEEAAAPPLAIAGEFVPLYSGKDLAGWQAHDKYPGKWRVENGILTGDGPNAGILHSTRADFQDFHLRAEARFDVPPDSSS